MAMSDFSWSTIFFTRRYCWSVHKSYIGGVSIGVEKQTQMTVVRQNILSTIMLKNVKLAYGNVRFQLVNDFLHQEIQLKVSQSECKNKHK